MDEEFGIPGSSTWAAPGWGGSSTTEPSYTPPNAEAQAMPTSRSAVPGTSGAPVMPRRFALWSDVGR
jgi:hypothetical protein